MKRKRRCLAIVLLALMVISFAIPAAAYSPTTGYYNGYRYTVTASRSGAKAYGTVNYEAGTFSPAVAIWGTRQGKNGGVISFETQWGTYSVSYTNPYGTNIVTVYAEGFVNGASVGIASN